MGLTGNSVNFKSVTKKEAIRKRQDNEKVIAIAGNPNVGKSTVFNALTGMHQHTGNWPGKTVSNASGYLKTDKNSYVLVDIPGTYSLIPHSAEEEVARDYLCFESPDAVLVVCDATCLEKNLNLVFQIIECTSNVLVCINLMDEARAKGINVNIKELSIELGVPVIGTIAHSKKSIKKLKNFIDDYFEEKVENTPKITYYSSEIEQEIDSICKQISNEKIGQINPRWVALKIIEEDIEIIKNIDSKYNSNLKDVYENNRMSFEVNGINHEKIKYQIIESIIKKSREIAQKAVKTTNAKKAQRDIMIDRILTGKFTGIPIMLLMVAVIFWITIVGANYLSSFLSSVMTYAENILETFLKTINAPDMITLPVVYGGFRVLSWVVAVMLPPMAIFFPFFTILEDSGYLARIAYNLDKPFYKCNACGKQALTMCMGFGCNAVGVTGARIIDSPRERLLAIITNSFMPCNGRFPMLITFITIFFVGINNSKSEAFIAALILVFVITEAVLITFFVTNFLSKTLLKGISSSYILELPSYRKPQFSKLIIRSVFDRTLFVLGRAVAVALPAGFIIWGLGNIYINGYSILKYCSNFLNPLGEFIGLDGAILLAFILGTPANEIVVPLMIMIYMSNNTLIEVADYNVLQNILVSNGWDIKKAVCVIIFAVFHWPCATTLLSIKKETGSVKWTVISALVPAVIGLLMCIIVKFLFKIFI